MYFTQADEPFEVIRYGDPESGGYLGAPMECLWETPWLDLGKAYMKRDFVLRFTADADENDVPVEMTIKTERREKTRVVLLQRQRKDYRVKIQVSGVRMKLKIRSHAKAGCRRSIRWMRFNSFRSLRRPPPSKREAGDG